MIAALMKPFRTMLAHPGLPCRVAALAFLCALPTAWSGWALDDHLLRVVMLGPPYSDFKPTDLFGIPNGDPGLISRYMEKGVLPFWTPPGFRIIFFRPLTVFAAWVDFQLWPDSPALMHLHTLFWFAALVFTAGLLYRSTAGAAWLCGLAALLNGLDAARALPAAWISSRHVLISSVFGVLTLLLHDRWRSRGWKPGSLLAPLAFVLALLAGEMAVATICYLVAYALFIDHGDWRSRLFGLVPGVCVVGIWLGMYAGFGFGAGGSGTYFHPVDDLPAFLGSLVTHAPVLLAAELLSIPAEAFALLPAPFAGTLALICALLILAVAAILLAGMRESAVAGFWGVGMLLSLIPAATTVPSGRLLSFVALGAAPLLASLAGRLADGGSAASWSILSRSVVGRLVAVLLAVKLLIAPLVFPIAGYVLHSIDSWMLGAIRTIPDGPGIAGQDLVIVNPPDHLYYAAYLFSVKPLEGRETPRALRVLAAGPTEMVTIRVDSATIRVKMPAGLYAGPFGRSFRSGNSPLRKGEVVRVSGMEAEVREVNETGDPVEMLYRFSRSLEDSRLRLIYWRNDEGYLPFVPPDAGDSLTFPPSRTPMDFF